MDDYLANAVRDFLAARADYAAVKRAQAARGVHPMIVKEATDRLLLCWHCLEGELDWAVDERRRLAASA